MSSKLQQKQVVTVPIQPLEHYAEVMQWESDDRVQYVITALASYYKFLSAPSKMNIEYHAKPGEWRCIENVKIVCISQFDYMHAIYQWSVSKHLNFIELPYWFSYFPEDLPNNIHGSIIKEAKDLAI